MKQVFSVETIYTIHPSLIKNLLSDYFEKLTAGEGRVNKIVVEEITSRPALGSNGTFDNSGYSMGPSGTQDPNTKPKPRSLIMKHTHQIRESIDTCASLLCALNEKLSHVQIPVSMSGQSGMSGITGKVFPLEEILRNIEYKMGSNNTILRTIIDRIDI
jgi:hypothetical protein